MTARAKNKEFVIRFFRELSGIRKNRKHIEQFVADEGLIKRLLFFDQVFPANKLLVDELTAEEDRVICRVRMKGMHAGELGDVPPTRKSVDFPMVLGCSIERNKIVSHWLIADQINLLEQLGIENKKS